MIKTGVAIMNGKQNDDLLRFLQDELAIPTDDLKLAIRQTDQIPSMLPMVLWQYGFVSIHQLEKIFDWLQN